MTIGLVGCASSSTPLADVLAAVTSEKFASGDVSDLTTQPKPDPLYRYLRIEVAGRASALLVLGYVDAHPQGNIEVWYSAKREIIKIQNGRIVGTTGLETDWRAVRFPSAPPVWTEVSASSNIYPRLRDEMPGHRYTIADRVELTPWQGVPPVTMPASLRGEQSRAYRWFRETTLSNTESPLPPSWFAWGMHRGQSTVVYSEQCLSAVLCLKLQRWPVQEETP